MENIFSSQPERGIVSDIVTMCKNETKSNKLFMKILWKILKYFDFFRQNDSILEWEMYCGSKHITSCLYYEAMSTMRGIYAKT